MPKYLAIAAVTIDGKIAAHKNHMSGWTSKEDKVFMRGLLNKCDVVIVGNNTYKTAIKPLSQRNCLVFSKSVDKLTNKSDKLTYINPAKTDIKKIIRQRGYKNIAILGGAQTYGWFLERQMIDELFLTIEPLAFGSGIGLFRNKKAGTYKFKFKSFKKLNKTGSVLLHYIKP